MAVHTEFTAAVVTCTISSQNSSRDEEGLMRPHPHLRSFGQLIAAEVVGSDRLPRFLWIAHHVGTYECH